MNYNFDRIYDRKNTNCSKWDNVGARVGNPDALPMWVADTDFPAPQPVIEAVLKRAEHPIYGYPFLCKDFVQVTGAWLKRRHNWDIDEKWVLFSPGVVPTLNTMVQAFTEPGEEVIIQRPVYYPFTNAITDNDRVVSSNSLMLIDGHYEIDFNDLEKRAKSPKARLMILCNPHNPVTRVLTKMELVRIAEICLKNNVIIVSDEIHSDIIFNGNMHTCIAAISDEIANITITAIAPSKTFNVAGLRASAIIISNPVIRKRLQKQFTANRTSFLNDFSMPGYIAAYTQCDDYLNQLVPYLEGNVRYMDDYLKTKMPKLKMVHPEGTFLMWIDCRELALSVEALDKFFIHQCLVAIDAGHWFGSEGNGFVRLNIGTPRATLKMGLERIYEQYCNL